VQVLLAILALALGGCSQFAIRSDHDRTADFTRFHTYAWLPLAEANPSDQRVLDRYVDTRIRRAVDTELRAKGYQPAGSGGADFLLNYRLTTEPASAVKGSPYLYGSGWLGWPGAEGFYLESYDQGTLYLAVVDPASKRLLWLGAASARLLPHLSIEKTGKRVDDAIHQLLARFPPA
jgi:hypothetical protein